MKKNICIEIIKAILYVSSNSKQSTKLDYNLRIDNCFYDMFVELLAH